MDLSKIKKHEGKCVIRAPFKGNKPIGLTIWMQSLKCEDVQNVRNRHAQENFALIKGGAELIPGAVKDRQATECYAAALTKWEWSGEANWKKEKPEFSNEKAVEVLSEADFILDQLVDFSRIEEHFYANFAKGS